MENKLEDERKVLVRIIENKDNEIRDNIDMLKGKIVLDTRKACEGLPGVYYL